MLSCNLTEAVQFYDEHYGENVLFSFYKERSPDKLSFRLVNRVWQEKRQNNHGSLLVITISDYSETPKIQVLIIENKDEWEKDVTGHIVKIYSVIAENVVYDVHVN
ncbi:MAG: hypothetical protein ABIE68_02005 [bacterium]